MASVVEDAQTLLSLGRAGLAFIDDGREFSNHTKIHRPRGVGIDNPNMVFDFNEVVCMHYAWANYERSLRRSYWYMVWYTVNGAKSAHHTSRNHNWHYHVKEEDLADCPPEWFANYRAKDLDVTSVVTRDLLWQDVQVLQWFKQYGEKKFRLLDIWRGGRWEEKRQLALQRGYPDIPQTPIKEPHPWIVFYSGLTAYHLSMRGILRKVTRRILRAILP